jgi:hypothetical protein
MNNDTTLMAAMIDRDQEDEADRRLAQRFVTFHRELSEAGLSPEESAVLAMDLLRFVQDPRPDEVGGGD